MSKTNFIVTLFNITRQVLQKELISTFYIWLIFELGTKILSAHLEALEIV